MYSADRMIDDLQKGRSKPGANEDRKLKEGAILLICTLRDNREAC